MSGVGILLVIVILALILMIYVLDFEWSGACVAGFCMGICLVIIIIVETHDKWWIFK